LTWFGLITTTVSPAVSSAATTGPSGRSIATSSQPALVSTSMSSRSPAALCSTVCRTISRPRAFTTDTA
jgi:hypothetical protein